MSSDSMKQAQRQSLRLVRDAYVRSLGHERRKQAEAAAAERLIGVLGSGTWASYIAIGSEIDPVGLAALAPPGQPIAYPWFRDRISPMLFRLGNGGGFTRGPFGISQPNSGQPEMLPRWIIVPLVGVDPNGNRIGQGAGHYDRTLHHLGAQGNVTTIGLAWDVQLINSVATDPWDQPLDLIVTPSRTIRAGS